MKKFHRISVILGLTLILGYFYFQKAQVPLPSAASKIRVTKFIKNAERTPASSQQGPAETKKSPNIKRQLLNRTLATLPPAIKFETDVSVDLGKNFSLASNIRALPLEKWSKGMGELLHRDAYFAYVTQHSMFENTWPVAYDKVLHAFYPVSHILHVKNASEDIRANLKVEGLKEYYFHQNTGLLSLESTPSSVLRHYQELKARGFDVRMEVLKDVVSPK